MTRRLAALALAVLACGCAAALSPEALAALRSRAEVGDVEVQLELGDRYRDGRGVERDSATAARWYRRAAASGVPDAMTRLVCRAKARFNARDLLGDDGVFPSVLKADDEDVIPPTLLVKADPKYTSEAMRAKLQGEVALEAVVRTDGTVGEVQVVKSLDRSYGLDASALCAALQWRFRPATREGRPIDVVVTIILEFRLH